MQINEDSKKPINTQQNLNPKTTMYDGDRFMMPQIIPRVWYYQPLSIDPQAV